MAEAGGSDRSPWAKGEAAFTSKEYSKYFDPCQEAATRSMKCLHRNGGNRQLCSDYFQSVYRVFAFESFKSSAILEARHPTCEPAG
ncbi:MAG: hypothetical protein ALECFALPRED_007511 [Alectoria fallacina]|uniref:Uncharacterized protein n=1 Tax=Alectoria fallacina TaxID=1903189 RepID=A0A8H3ED43_9LECA|nr:MAG: hypothetical protein ALECFALPRED_007511 [Alectoria fallacina]